MFGYRTKVIRNESIIVYLQIHSNRSTHSPLLEQLSVSIGTNTMLADTTISKVVRAMKSNLIKLTLVGGEVGGF